MIAFEPASLEVGAGRIEPETIRWLILGCIACLYLPFIFTGPGSDPDSIREIRSGATLLWQHRYVLSRPPGYFPYEALCGILDAFGGTIVNNLATVVISLAALDCFLAICRHFQIPHRYLLGFTMAIHPVYWAASTSTIDFVWALGCFLLGLRMLLSDRYWSAAAMCGLSIGIRLSSVLLVVPLLTLELVARPREARLWTFALLTAAIGAFLYLPEFIASGNSLRFLTYYLGEWTLTDRVGRLIYKNVYFWGLPAATLLLVFAPMLTRKLISDRGWMTIVALAGTIVVSFEALFFKLPVQRAYLLPMLPFALMLIGIGLRDRRRLLGVFAGLIFSYNFVNLNLARPDVPDRATRAIVGIAFEPGYLLTDVSARLALARMTISTGSH